MALEVNAWPDFAPDFVRGLGLFSRIADFASIILFAMIAGAIANTMLMAAFERTKEIGTIASLGGRRYQIVFLFVCEALVLGLAGTALGSVGGVALTRLLGATGIHFPPLPAQTVDLILRPEVALGSLVKGAALAVVVSVAAAAYPASVAASVRPIEALSHV
jgi:putative ABC transport system permease protein